MEKEEEEKEKSAFFSSSFAEDGNGAALDDPEIVPRSEMWRGQHNNQPIGGTAIHMNNLYAWAMMMMRRRRRRRRRKSIEEEDEERDEDQAQDEAAV